MKPIIKVENLSKQYRLGSRSAPYRTLRETFSKIARSPIEVFSRKNHNKGDLLWALRDVSFEIEPGEVVGIIGGNGAGKSTLLKILARVTEPTRGRIELYGRASSLLEVGTGFHPELTGRENIFVNGAILGLKNFEIKRLLDEIVEFAGIEKFLDTTVKHYSSGMYMRLAFSVAAHLNPEILIIDEVLSVGDQQFQKKCLDKVQEVAKSGRTVLFVSHNMAAVENICRRGIVLKKGEITFIGEKSAAVSHYLAGVNTNFNSSLKHRADRIGTGEVRVTAFEIKDFDGNLLYTVRSGQDIELHFHFETAENHRSANVFMSFIVATYLEVPVFLQHNKLTGDDWEFVPASGVFVCRIRKFPLPPSTYRLAYSVMRDNEYLDRIDSASQLTVTEGDFFGSGELPPSTHGCCLVDAEWQILDSDAS